MTTVAIFRPEGHLQDSKEVLEELGFKVRMKSLLEPQPTGNVPITDTDIIIFTSSNGVRFALSEISPKNLYTSTICAIGPKTEEALKERDVPVDIVPDVHSSNGLIDALSLEAKKKKVEVARSTEGSDLLVKGLINSDAFVHETQLYKLAQPTLDEGELEKILNPSDVFLFTSSLMVKNLLELAKDPTAVKKELNDKFVGAIGAPTGKTLTRKNISVDLIAAEASFTTLAEETREALT